MGIFDFLKQCFGGGSSKFTGEKAAALKKYKLDPSKQNINFVDIKSGYSNGVLGGTTYFQHISANHPLAIKDVGLDPSLRDEVNFNSIGNKTSAFQGSSSGGNSYRFIFAFKCDGQNDTQFNKALKNLGWLQPPSDGGDKYLYIFTQDAGTEYFSPAGVLNKSSEVMFAHTITPDKIAATYRLRWNGKATPTVTRHSSMSMGMHRART